MTFSVAEPSDVNKDSDLKAKARTKDQTFKAKVRTKDSRVKAKAMTKDLRLMAKDSTSGHNKTVELSKFGEPSYVYDIMRQTKEHSVVLACVMALLDSYMNEEVCLLLRQWKEALSCFRR